MAVTCKRSKLMGMKRYNIHYVFEQAGLARSTITALYHDKATKINYETINKLCTLFDCKIEDLFEFIKDE